VTVADEMKVTFLFDFDSAAIKDVHRKSAQDVARFVRGGKDTRIALGGHTDSIGDSQYNQALSERRAAAVKKLLARTLNVPASAISVRGFGEARPEVARETRANRHLNRRVEATVTTKRTRSRYSSKIKEMLLRYRTDRPQQQPPPSIATYLSKSASR
jgi:OOP family OmpA-OmpF porin